MWEFLPEFFAGNGYPSSLLFFFLDRNRQGAKKVIFTACHSGEPNLTFTSPNIISTSTKNVLMSRLISQFSCILNSSKNFTCPSGKLITEFTSPIAKSSSPGLSDTAFFARWTGLLRLYVRFQCRSCDNTLQKVSFHVVICTHNL